MARGSWWRMCSISIMGVALKIAVLADEDVEEDPDRWCSYSECGQELWQIACQWVWNLRLCLGQTMQGVQVRELEWAPAKAAPAVYGASEPSPQEYGPWQWAAAFGKPVLLGPMRWVDVAGRALRRTWMSRL